MPHLFAGAGMQTVAFLEPSDAALLCRAAGCRCLDADRLIQSTAASAAVISTGSSSSTSPLPPPPPPLDLTPFIGRFGDFDEATVGGKTFVRLRGVRDAPTPRATGESSSPAVRTQVLHRGYQRRQLVLRAACLRAVMPRLVLRGPDDHIRRMFKM